MKFEDIKFKDTDLPKGIQALLKFGEYELSIVKSDFSYGGNAGLYEIAVFKATVRLICQVSLKIMIRSKAILPKTMSLA